MIYKLSSPQRRLLAESDDYLRRLERQASTDPQALERYEKALQRSGKYVEYLYNQVASHVERRYAKNNAKFMKLSDNDKFQAWQSFIGSLYVRSKHVLDDLLKGGGLQAFLKADLGFLDLMLARNMGRVAMKRLYTMANHHFSIPIKPLPSFVEYKKRMEAVYSQPGRSGFRIGPERRLVDFETWFIEENLNRLKWIIDNHGIEEE